ncbi:MAG: regulator SirB [Betaproteobacteria bacterium]|nr:MAG: regulator SirB [Betaproteobacteria bacterium]
MYHLTRFVHELCALASFSLFALRGVWMLRDSPQLSRRWVKILPHGIDTLLLASAIALTLMLHQYPLTHAWLSAKLTGLLVYIGLGLIALRYGKTRSVRAAAWIGALAVFLYIASVALSHDPLGFFRVVT